MEMEYRDNSRRGKLIIALGIVLALIVGAASFFLLSQASQQASQGPVQKVSVVVAAKDIVARTPVVAGDVTLRQITLDATTQTGARVSSACTSAEKRRRSTTSALPPGTRARSAHSSNAEPRTRSSALSRPWAFSGSSDLSELEHTSSATSSVSCASVIRAGRISSSRTATPRLAHCSAASHPACPAPTTMTSYLGEFVFKYHRRYVKCKKCSTWNAFSIDCNSKK